MSADRATTTDELSFTDHHLENTMLTNPTIETLKSLKLHGCIEALEEQQRTPSIQALSFEEQIGRASCRERVYSSV